MFKKNAKFNCSSGKQTRDFLYIDDFIKIGYQMYRKENVYNKILNAGSGNPTTVKKIIYSIQRLVKSGHLWKKILFKKR